MGPLVGQLFSDIDAALDHDQARSFVVQDVSPKYGEFRVTYRTSEGRSTFPHELIDNLICSAEAQSERVASVLVRQAVSPTRIEVLSVTIAIKLTGV